LMKIKIMIRRILSHMERNKRFLLLHEGNHREFFFL
jgi:hypothetical protein